MAEYLTAFHPLVHNFGNGTPSDAATLAQLPDGATWFDDSSGKWYYLHSGVWTLASGASGSAATTTALGTVKMSTAPVDPANPIAVGDNDTRMTNSRTPTGAAGGDLAGTYPNPTLITLSPSPAGTYGNPASVTVDANGRVTSVTAGATGGSVTLQTANPTTAQSGRINLDTTGLINGSSEAVIQAKAAGYQAISASSQASNVILATAIGTTGTGVKTIGKGSGGYGIEATSDASASVYAHATGAGEGVKATSSTGSAGTFQTTTGGSGTSPTVVIQGASSQQADLLLVKDSAGTTNLAQVKSDGTINSNVAVQLGGITMLQRGTYSSKPASPVSGQRYYATDYNCWFVYSSLAWQQEDVPAWTSFPSSPIVGLRVFRSDRNTTYTYNGTYWLTEPKMVIGWYNPGLPSRPWSNTISASAFQGFMVVNKVSKTYGFYVSSLYFTATPTAPFDASNYFTVTVYQNTGSLTLLGTFNLTSATDYQVLTNTAFTLNSINNFRFDLTVGAGSPGPVYVGLPSLEYQLIG